MKTDAHGWRDSTRYGHGFGHVLTLQYLGSTMESLELLEDGWKFENDGATLLEIFEQEP